ncbi:MAG TPA: hypothetical protein VLI55_05765 [Bryobacteraceae bacterium]|nr:hypothetical protein [Bryobacteraceae bacterium]
MPETRTSAIAIPAEPERSATVLQSTTTVLSRTAAWAGDTAQEFGALLSVLMGPAVFSAYAFAFWSLAANLGWTDTFLFASGPLSNWLVWLGIAILINLAASVLRRHTEADS